MSMTALRNNLGQLLLIISETMTKELPTLSPVVSCQKMEGKKSSSKNLGQKC